MGRYINGVGNILGLAVAGKYQADTVVIEDACIGLAQLQRLGQCLVAGHLEQTSLSGDGLSVDGKLCAVLVGLVKHEQAVCHVGAYLRGIREAQCVVGCRTAGDIAHHGLIDINLGHLYLHGGLHDDGSRLIVLGHHLTLVGIAGLSASCTENGAEVAVIVHIDRQGVVTVFRQGEGKRRCLAGLAAVHLMGSTHGLVFDMKVEAHAGNLQTGCVVNIESGLYAPLPRGGFGALLLDRVAHVGTRVK